MVVTKITVVCDCCEESKISVDIIDNIAMEGWRNVNGKQFCVACYGTFTYIAKAIGVDTIPQNPEGLEEPPQAKTKRFKVLLCRFHGRTNELLKKECNYGVATTNKDRFNKLSAHERNYHPLAYNNLPADKKGRGNKVFRKEAWRYYK